MKTRIIGLSILLMGMGIALHSQDKENANTFRPAKIVSATAPNYPFNVVNPGTVILEVTVGPTGKSEGVRVVQAMPPFTEEALKTVEKWVFEPAQLGGQPVQSAVPVVISFSQPTIWSPQTNRPEAGTSR